MKSIGTIGAGKHWFVALAAVVIGSLRIAAADIVWLETEQFEEFGGWVNDSQFVDQMGSPYLLADGIGTPAKDAVTHVDLPRADRWRLWARARDWEPKHHPGRFQILLNGKPVGREFGASGKNGWSWEDGGSHELSGKIELRLRDLTGYYGRCDVIVLTTDFDWTPPDGKDAIAALREKFGGVSREVRNAGDYDVVVVGGGLAGCMAAVSSARMGARTALIQNRPVLGGNGSTEILVPPVGVWPGGRWDARDPRETGLIEEVRTIGNQRAVETRYYSGRLQRLCTAEPNLTLRLNTHVTGVQTRPNATNTIAAVFALDVKTGERLRFTGRIFVDCTGDGIVGKDAGAVCRRGRESRSMHNESLAPEKADETTMGNSLKYFSQSTGTKQTFVTPPWAVKFASCDDFPERRHPPHLTAEMGWQWMLELGGMRDTYRDKEEIRDDLLKLIYGIWDHVKNGCPKLKDEAADHKLVWVGSVAGVRESWRLIGDCIFTENNMAEQTLFPDRVAYGAWGLDDHYSEGFFHRGLPSHHPYTGRLHSIPYRSLYSTNVVNLLMAGRDISATHIGMGTTRVQLTCAVMGQAAGTAAGMCVERGATPREIYRSYLDKLQQQLLKDGAYIIDLPNHDPADLARAAHVTASSEGIGTKGEPMPATNVINGIARVVGHNGNAWMPNRNVAPPHWIELAWREPQKFNVVHVTFFTKRHTPKHFAVEAWVNGSWKKLAEVGDKPLRRHVLGLERVTASKLRVVLSDAVGICEIRVYDEPERVVEIARRAANNQRLPDVSARLPWETSDVPEDATITSGAKSSPGMPLEEAVKKFGGILLDDSEAETTGDWGRSTYSKPFISDGYLTDGNGGKGAKSASFRPNLPKAGAYEVRLAYAAENNRATNTPVTIRTSRGEKTMVVNQRRAPEIAGLFHSLGRFDLDAGSATAIVISNTGTDGYVVVDAVQIVP
ncbi:MAG: FAD-dependent oxidoreductase [Verrucomicrobia bacterium]|nr:FAD-dependent oxidoreductase [Verrucomicrobiota bacterium]